MSECVSVVGGGIAGLATALFLNKSGREVCVHEREAGHIDRVCGEGILPFGIEVMGEIGLSESLKREGYPIRGIRYGFGEKTVLGRFDTGHEGLGIERGRLHSLMQDACLERGVKLELGHTFNPNEISTQWIDARGLRAARQSGKRILSRRFGLRCRVDGVSADQVEVHFEPYGEMYCTPVSKDRISVAFLLDPKRVPVHGTHALKDWAVSQVHARFSHLPQGAVSDIKARAPIAGFWSRVRVDRIRVGDALCAFDPISGAGMSFALLSARSAARHADSPKLFYRDMVSPIRAVESFTSTLLLCSGGGWRTALMMRQLQPDLLTMFVKRHDAQHRIFDLKLAELAALINPITGRRGAERAHGESFQGRY